MDRGYFSVQRAIVLDPLFLKNPKLGWFFLYCHSKAMFRDYAASTKLGTLHLKRGQFYRDFRTMAEELKVPKSTLQNWAAKLEKMGHISMKTGPHFCVITVLKYTRFESAGEKVGPQKSKKRDADHVKSGPIRIKREKEKNKRTAEPFEKVSGGEGTGTVEAAEAPHEVETGRQAGQVIPIGTVFDPKQFPMSVGENISQWHARISWEVENKRREDESFAAWRVRIREAVPALRAAAGGAR